MKKILICDDDSDLREILKTKFSEDGWDVTTAEDGEVAIQNIKKDRFNLVLLDLLMPKKNGFEVLQEIKSNPLYLDISIIVFSSLWTDDDIKKALALGATDYFTKSQHFVGEILEKAKAYQGGHATSVE